MSNDPNYYAVLYKNPSSNSSQHQSFTSRSIEQLFRTCFEGFANTDTGDFCFRVAIICTKYPPLSEKFHSCLLHAYAQNAVESHYIPQTVLKKAPIADSLRAEFETHKEININVKKKQYIQRIDSLCIGHFRSDCPFHRIINDTIRYQIILPLFFHLVPHCLISGANLSETIDAINKALTKQDDFFLNYSLNTFVSSVNQQYMDSPTASTVDEDTSSIQLPKYYRFILSLPFEVFQTACANAPPYVDRIVRLEGDDSLKVRYTDKLKENANNDLLLDEFVLTEYPDLIDLSKMDKSNQENQKTNSPTK